MADATGLRVAIAAAVVAPVAALGLRAPRTALYCLVVWLAALGLVRRLTSGISPKQASGDPLLLVGTTAWVVLAVAAARYGAFIHRTALTNAVLALSGLLTLSGLNPGQGEASVGLTGLMLVVVPMSAFLVGRALVDVATFARLLRLVAWIGVAAATYGLLQTFSGFPSWDAEWIANGGYTSLNVGGVIRPFASFSAASEYAAFLGLAVVAWVALGRGLIGWGSVAAAVGVLSVALWYESARWIVVLTIAAVALMAAARAGLSFVRATVVALALVALLPTIIGWVSPDRFSDDAGGRLFQHQVEGLIDPFGEGSTLPHHIRLMWGGVKSAYHKPLGSGVGSITIWGGRYGGPVGGAEADPGRVPFAAGLPGLIAYTGLVMIAFPRAYRLAALRRDTPSLAALGIVTVTFLQWLNGGHYAVAFWGWLALGWIDQPTAPIRDPLGATAGLEGVQQQRPEGPPTPTGMALS